jgi:DnaK suppressor protein
VWARVSRRPELSVVPASCPSWSSASLRGDAGTGIYLPGNAARALRALGLEHAVADRAVAIPKQRFCDARGRCLSAASCLQHCADQMELERARDLLRRERVRIERALARLSVPGREELAGQDEMADAASQLYEEEFDEGQADDLRAELAAVERAEQRLFEGTYGRSIESGKEIPDERLEAVPAAERTAAEQARFERHAH